MKLGSNVYPSLRSGVKDQLQTCVRHESVSLALSSWWQLGSMELAWRSSHESGSIKHNYLLLHWSLNCFPPLFSTWANSQRFLMTCQAISGIILPTASYRPYHSMEQLVKVSEKSKRFSVLCRGKPIKSAIWSNYNDWQINAMFCNVLSINLPI